MSAGALCVIHTREWKQGINNAGMNGSDGVDGQSEQFLKL
jgi:hypothetical protein